MEQYVLAKLADPDIEVVEEHLLSCQDCRDHLLEVEQFVTTIQAAARKLERSEAAEGSSFCHYTFRRVLDNRQAAVNETLSAYSVIIERMAAPVFLVLGGYGRTGLAITRLLLEQTPARVILAGRHSEQAELASRRFNEEFAGRASAAVADAADFCSLRTVLQGTDFVIAASSTARYAGNVARAALEAGADYLDIHYSRQKNAALNPLAPEIERAGRCFITEAGFHPGLPAALVRYAAASFDSVERATVASVVNPEEGLPLTESLYEFVEEFRDWQSLYYSEGAWRSMGWFSGRGTQRVDFGTGFGTRRVYPMALEEMLPLPRMFPTLRAAGFYVSGWNWFADYIATPLMLLSLRAAPHAAVRPMARLMSWSLRTFSRPPWGVVTKVEVSGTRGGAPCRESVVMFHKDGYAFTAIPVVACLLQYLDGSARKPGLWMMGHLADPARLVADMRRMGVSVC